MKVGYLILLVMGILGVNSLSLAQSSGFATAISKAILAEDNPPEFWRQTAEAWKAAQSKNEREAIAELEMVTLNRVVRDADTLLDFLERIEVAHPDLVTPKFYRAELLRQTGQVSEAQAEIERVMQFARP